MELLAHTPNPFRGVVVNPGELPEDPQTFQQRLVPSLKTWKQEDFRVVWLEVPIQLAGLIPIAVEAGFTFHHSTEDYLMLTLRLEEGAFIPPFATHYIGAGGVVLKEDEHLLVVCEKHRRTKTPFYKLPGGALHPGEHLEEAIKREVLEETGVQTRFEALVCFRHWHGYRYDKSDIYFVCRLSPLNHDISMQAEEIEECFWMPVTEYLNSDHVGTFNKQIVQAALKSPGVSPTQIEGYSDPQKHEIFMPNGIALE